MYESFEIPTFRIKILYHDYEYGEEIPSKLLMLLKKHGFFPPKYIYAERLTKRKFIEYGSSMEKYIIDAYTQKELFNYNIINAEELDSTEFMRMDWVFTYFKMKQFVEDKSAKQKKLENPDSHKPWNVLNFVSTYGKLGNEEFRKSYFQCVQELIQLLKPFYATADDTAVAVNMSQVTGMNRVLPTEYGKVKAIHWGNYFGPEYCEKYGLTLDSKLPLAHIETIGDGLFFTLTESPLDFDSKECAKRRKEIARKLGIKPPNLLWR